MTPNLKTILGLPFLNGRFVSAMTTVAEAVKSSKDEVDPVWRLLMRDDIVAWYCKSMAKSDSKLQDLEKQLADRVSKNVVSSHCCLMVSFDPSLDFCEVCYLKTLVSLCSTTCKCDLPSAPLVKLIWKRESQWTRKLGT
jgi:hypothetical protein